MRIVYIGDNQNRLNWGCRATSAALSDLISENNIIVGRITGRLTLNEDYINIPLANGIFNKIIYCLNSIVPSMQQIWNSSKLIRKSSRDYLSYDFEESIKQVKMYARANKQYKEFDLDQYEYDAVVINGEGTMIMSTPARRDTLLYLLFSYWAIKRGKKVYFLNAMFSDCPATERNKETISLTKKILSKCTMVTARENYSYRYAIDIIGLRNCKMIPDALFTWKYKIDNTNLNRKYICISGSSRAAWDQTKAKYYYMRLVNRIKQISPYKVIIVQACEGDLFLKEVAQKTHTEFVPANVPIDYALDILAHASLFISGRYHPSIMAALGGTPCVFLGSNSHKCLALQDLLKYEFCHEYCAYPKENEIDEICELVLGQILGDEKRQEIINTVEKIVENAREYAEIIQ